jgi:hypothetical protein
MRSPSTPAGCRLAPVAGLALLLCCFNTCRADEWYFVAVFSAQRMPNVPRYSHSFATFVRVVRDQTQPNRYWMEAHTISWLPETLNIRSARLRPERGRNLDLETTLAFVEALGDRVSLWGPYQIRKELYDRALAQIARLESGVIRYKAVDALYRTSDASNCIHALSDVVDDQRRLRITSPGFGEVASYYVTRRFEPWLIYPGQVYPWVGVCLGLDRHAIFQRGWGEVPRLFFRCGFPDSP